MKSFLATLFVCCMIVGLHAQNINEFHYDNASTDVGEFVEVFIPNPQPGDLSMYTVTLYNGNSTYNSNTLDAMTVTCDATGCYYVWSLPTNGMQNGGSDGLALSGPGGLIEFLSYEGTINATVGPAAGTTSTDVGVSETGSTPAGTSISLNAMGTWETGIIATPGSINTNALPIQLVKFEASTRANQGIALNWTTATEIDNEFFAVEHSTDGQNFREISTVDGAGNSFTAQEYSFVHTAPSRGVNYYRLKQVDFSRAFSFSEVASADWGKATKLTVWPTLVEMNTTVDLGEERIDGKLSVTNMQGQVMYTQVVKNQSGKVEVNLAELASGTYVISLDVQGAISSSRILIQR